MSSAARCWRSSSRNCFFAVKVERWPRSADSIEPSQRDEKCVLLIVKTVWILSTGGERLDELVSIDEHAQQGRRNCAVQNERGALQKNPVRVCRREAFMTVILSDARE